MEISAPVAIIPIFIGSLLGSGHCAGMCGGFVAWYSHSRERHVGPHLLYSLGRLTTYLTLGISAAWFGKSVDGLSNISKFSALLVGAILIASGLIRVFGFNFLLFPKFWSRLGTSLGRLFKKLPLLPSKVRPFFIGLVTTLLRCGWLYSFVALAMASANVWHAVIIMCVFWCGTLPVMCTLGFFSRNLTARLGAHLPRVTGLLLVMSGLLSLMLHLQHAGHAPHCH